MNRKLIFILTIVIVLHSAVFAQTRDISRVRFDNIEQTKREQTLVIRMDIRLNGLNLKGNDMLIITPVVRSINGVDSAEMSPVVLLGGVRDKIVRRNMKKGNPSSLPYNMQTGLLRKNNTAQSVSYDNTLRYSPWMKDAALYVRYDLKSCANCNEYLGDRLLVERIFKEQYLPTYKLTYVVPEVAPVKQCSKYGIDYTVRRFDLEEAKRILKTDPKLLSLNEMYLLAETYPVDSKEFKEVFDIAARLYPDDPIAILNCAATEIEIGNNQRAVERLSKIGDDPRSWNNIGVAYVRMRENDKAMEYFEKAAASCDPDAIYNLEELKKALKE